MASKKKLPAATLDKISPEVRDLSGRLTRLWQTVSAEAGTSCEASRLTGRAACAVEQLIRRLDAETDDAVRRSVA